MPFFHGKNVSIVVWDAGGTCRNMSGDKNSVTLAWGRNNPETTTFGKVATQRIAGLQDGTLSGAGIWNSDASSGIDAVLSGIMYTASPTLIRLTPAGSSGTPYGGYFQSGKYQIDATVNNAVAARWEVQLSEAGLVKIEHFTVGYSPIGLDSIA